MNAVLKRFLSLKTILIGVGGLIVLLIAAAAAFIAFFPKDWAVAEVTRRIEDSTGRQLVIAGDVDVAFWPALGFSAEQISLSNPEGFSEDDPFVASDRIVFAVKVLPLLRGAIEVKELILEGADLRLASKPDGEANWTFPTEESEEQPATIDDLRLDDVRLIDSRLSFQSGDGGAPLTLENINGALHLDSLDEPAQLEAAFDYRDQQINLDAEVGLPRAMLEQGQTPFQAEMRSSPLKAQFEGAFDSARGALSGQVKADGRSMRELLAWMGSPLQRGDGFGPFQVEAALSHEGQRTALTNGRYKLDDIEAMGDVAIILSDEGRVRVEGALETASLNLNPYMPPAPANTGEGGVDTSTEWSAAPIDLSGLRAIDANLDLTIGALQFQRMHFSDARMALSILGGVADARLSRISLYGGGGTARFIADGAHATPRIALDLDLNNVQALPLLTEAIGFDKIEGAGRLRASLGGQGASQAAIMRSLRGTASFNFNDGAWRGVNLAQIARTVQSFTSGQQVSATGSNSTDFAEMSASFQLADGVAATEDLKLLNPYIRLDGAGLVDIGGQTIDMRLSPRAVNSIEGQGGQSDLQGLGVPFRISGPWSRPSFRPDLGDAIRQQLRDRISAAAGEAEPDSPLGMLSTAIFGAPPQSQTQTETTTEGESAAADETENADEATAEETPEPTPEQRMRDAFGGLFKTN